MGNDNVPHNIIDSLCESSIIKKSDWFLLIPVKLGYIKYTDLKDGSIDFRDLIVINEMIRIQNSIDDYFEQVNAIKNKIGGQKW